MLGNLLLRITSLKIQNRLIGVMSRTSQEIHQDAEEGSSNRLLISALLELPDKFQASMDNLEVSDALAAIIDVLRLVSRGIFISNSLFKALILNCNRPIKQ